MSDGEESFVEECFTDNENPEQAIDQPAFSGIAPAPNHLSMIPEEQESSAFGSSCGLARSFNDLSRKGDTLGSFSYEGKQEIDQHQRDYFKDPTRDMAIVDGLGLMPRYEGNSWDMGFSTPRKSDMGKKRVVIRSPEVSGTSAFLPIPLGEEEKENNSTPTRMCSKENMASPPPKIISNNATSLPGLSSPPARRRDGFTARLRNQADASTPIQNKATPRPVFDVSAIPGTRIGCSYFDVGLSVCEPTIDEEGSVVNKSDIKKVFTNTGGQDAQLILDMIRKAKLKKQQTNSTRFPVEISKANSQAADIPRHPVEKLGTGSAEAAIKQEVDVGQMQENNVSQKHEAVPIRSCQIELSRFASNREASTNRTSRPSSVNSVASAATRSSSVSRNGSALSEHGPLRIGRSKVMFGCQNVGESILDRINLKNNLDEVQKISISVKRKDGVFEILNKTNSILMSPKEEISLDVRFTPSADGRYQNDIKVKSEKFTKTYTIPLYGAGGQCSLRPIETEDLKLNAMGYTLVTDSSRTIQMSVKNVGVRRAYCAVVLMCNGRRIPCTVTPAPYLIIAQREAKKIVLTTKSDFSSYEMPSSSGRESTTSNFSSVSSSSTLNDQLSVVLYWGEDMMRQRLIGYMDLRPNAITAKQSYERYQVKFAAEEFTGNSKEEIAKEWPLSETDKKAFENFMRTIRVRVLTTRQSQMDFDETLKPDDTLRERTSSNMSMVQDVTKF